MRIPRVRFPFVFPAARVSGVRLFAAFLVLALGAMAAQAQLGRSRLSGSVKFEGAGEGTKLVLVLEPDETTNTRPQEIKIGKKGSFSNPFLPAGTYKPTLEGEQYFLKWMHYMCKDTSGRVLGEFETGAHPETGLPEITLPPGVICEAEFMVAPAEQKREYERQLSLAEARGPLKAIAELYESGDYQAVVKEADALIADKPELSPAHYLRGVALRQLGRLEDSIAGLARAVELGFEQPGLDGVRGSVLLERAQELVQQGKSEQAKDFFARAADMYAKEVEKSGPSRPLLQNRAVALDQAGRQAEAIPVIEQLLEIAPDDVTARLHLASLYQEWGDEQKALDTLDELPSGSESAAKTVYNVASKLYNEKRYEQALLAANKAQEIHDFPLVHHLKGYIHMAMGQQQDALTELRAFVEAAPDDPNAEQDRQLIQALEKQVTPKKN